MKKLKIHHLSPYLPYKLKFVANGEVYSLDGVDMNGDAFDADTGEIPFKIIKPILRPLSDLSSLGDENIPINEHTINTLICEKHGLEYGIFSQYKGMLDIELDGDPLLNFDKNKSISLHVVLDIYNELLKGHYDIFGLLDEGMAENINNLKKQI